MLDADLIQIIKEHDTVETANVELSAALNDEKLYPGVALPNNYTVHDLEKYMAGRSRFRGRLSTKSIDHFCTYVEEHQNDDKPAVYIDDEEMSANAFFNLGTIKEPGHGDDTAVLKLRETAAYADVLSVNGHTMSQRELAEWLEDWEDNLEALDGSGNAIQLTTAISQIRNIEIKQDTKAGSYVGHFKDQQTLKSETSVGTKEGESLPSGFRFTCETWSELPERTFMLRLAAIGEKGLNLKIVKLESMLEKIVDDFKALLEEKLAENSSVTVGSFNTKGN